MLESCEGKSIEYCTAARMVQFVETDASGMPDPLPVDRTRSFPVKRVRRARGGGARDCAVRNIPHHLHSVDVAMAIFLPHHVGPQTLSWFALPWHMFMRPV